VKLIVIAAVILGIGMLAGTRKDTPFIRWGVIMALVGVLLTLTSAIFTIRGIAFGTILAVVGVLVYYYGRFARHERIFVAKPK
jgi:hypothetical protein